MRGEGTGTDGDADADTDTDTDTDTDADADADGDTDPGVVCDADCPDLVWVPIPGGTFPMGSDDGDPNEQPVHGVTVPSFDMTRSEVTVSQYAECVAASMCAQPGDYEEYDSWNWGVDGREDHPMHAVSWNDAAVFCAWVGGRLPSEAEWEYAARSGGQEITYPWGEAEPTCERAVMYEGTYGCGLGTYTMEVCSKPAGSTGQGLCDMAGNVWEWVRDWYHPNYDGAPEDGGAWEDQESDLRVARGGSYYSGAFNLRTSLRLGFGPSIVQFHLGFRCARDVD